MGIGCWSYGGGDYWGDQAQSDVDAVANTALDAGIVFFDTAVGYNEGRSEQSLGIALKHRRLIELDLPNSHLHHKTNNRLPSWEK